MKLERIIETLEAIVPPLLAEPWDNTGLLIRPLKMRPIRRILLTIDLTEAVADEAAGAKVDLIITYHPILFRAVNRLDAGTAHDRMVMKLVQKNIAVYSPHTALDAVIGGVNDWLADGVGDGEISVLQPVAGTDAGQGRRVVLNRPVQLSTLVRRIRRHLGLQSVRAASPPAAGPVSSIAVCAGAGTDVFQGIEADCYVTGEMSHHQVLAFTQNGAHVILCEHTRTERGYLPHFRRVLLKAFGPAVEIALSAADSDPVRIL